METNLLYALVPAYNLHAEDFDEKYRGVLPEVQKLELVYLVDLGRGAFRNSLPRGEGIKRGHYLWAVFKQWQTELELACFFLSASIRNNTQCCRSNPCPTPGT